MKQKGKNIFNGIFRIFLMLFLCFAIFCGCAGGDDDNNPSNVSPATPVESTGPINEYSSITVNPSKLPADGKSEAIVRVTLADYIARLVSDGTEVHLNTTMGTIISENPVKTSGGRAEFILQAPTSAGRGILTLPDYSDISPAEIVFGSIGSGVPASIRIESVNPSEIAVTGVGEPDIATVRTILVDETGNTIDGSDYIMHARMLARPYGGERFSQGENDGDSDTDIQIPIIQGNSSFHVQSGNLPGALEIEVEVLDKTEQSLDPEVKTLIPRISIASGPPHMVFLSTSNPPKVVDLSIGSYEGIPDYIPDFGIPGLNIPDTGVPQTPDFYCLYAGLSVNDRWGNPVPDGTVINLGVMDTVISSGEGISEGDFLMDSEANFLTDQVDRNDEIRKIEPGDRVVIKSASHKNKARFIENVITDDQLRVNKPYDGKDERGAYVVGASLLGGSIHGIQINEEGLPVATKGTVQTKEGLGQIRFVYPANVVRVYENDDSMRVFSIFTTSDNGHAVLVDEGTLGFYPVAGGTIIANTSKISQTSPITLKVVDGNGLPLPFITISSHVLIEATGSESLVIDAEECTTDLSGTCTAEINISGGSPGALAFITYTAHEVNVKQCMVIYDAPEPVAGDSDNLGE